jgi:hypothetical protein
MNPFSALTSKIFAGTSIALLLIVGGMYLMLHRANGQIEQLRGNLAECNAARAVQNAAVQRLHDEGVQQQQAFDAAVQHGQDAIAQAQGRVRIVRETANNGCPTPQSVRDAGL